jgi:hypothetical protein
MPIQTSNSALGVFNRTLTAFLRQNMPSIKAALEGWPSPNQQLVYPSVTVVTRIPKYTPLSPYVISKDPVSLTDNTMKYRTMVGMYDLSIQLDIWTSYKIQRDQMVEELIHAFNVDPAVPGIRIQLADYFNEWAQLSISSVQYVDDEQAVQRNEWRAMVQVLSNLRVIKEQIGYPMQTIESQLETPASIVPDAVTLPPLLI